MRRFTTVLALLVAGLATDVLVQVRDPGRVVEDRRVHARQLRGPEPGLIPQLLALRPGNIVIPDPVISRARITGNARSVAEGELAQLVCYSKAMLVGRFLGGTSRLTDDESWLFNEWSFAVERLYKDVPGKAGATIDVVLPGGRLHVNGRTVTALNDNVPVFPNLGQRFLLFLWAMDETGAYMVGAGVSLRPSAPTEPPPGPDSGMHVLDEAALLGLTDTLVSTITRAGDSNCGFARLDLSPLRATTPEAREIATAFDHMGSGPIADLDPEKFRHGEAPPEIGIWLPDGNSRRPGAEPTYLAWLASAVCSSDAVVFGASVGERTFLNGRETFLFTQRQFRVDQWLKPAASPGQPTIQVNTPGGTASVGGVNITAVGGSPFESSEPSVVFLRRVGTTRGYVVASPPGQVVFRDGLARIIGETDKPYELSQGQISREGFLADIANANVSCK